MATISKFLKVVNDKRGVFDGRLVIEVDPFVAGDIVSIVAIIVKDVDNSVIVFCDDFSISCLLEDLSNHTWSQLTITRGIFIEDLL